MKRHKRADTGDSQSNLVAPGPDKGIEFAWKTHSAIAEWTAKVDYKAAIVLSLGGVLLGFYVTLSGHGRVLADLHHWRLSVERAGLLFSIIGVFISGLVVAPRLNRRSSKKTWKDNFIYFGHLHHWDAVDLKNRLQSIDSGQELEVLAVQLVSTSKIAWRKHSLLQFAISLIALGAALVTIAAAWP